MMKKGRELLLIMECMTSTVRSLIRTDNIAQINDGDTGNYALNLQKQAKRSRLSLVYKESRQGMTPVVLTSHSGIYL
jgi:hypothetical protein